MKWAWLEFPECDLADDGNAVRPVERDSRQVEDSSNSRIGPQPDQSDQNTANAKQPHGINGRIRCLVNLVPNSRKRQHLVSRVRPDGAGPGLDGRHGGEVQHDERGDSEEDAAAFAHDVVEDLRNGLQDRRFEDRVIAAERAHGVCEHDSVQPAANVSEAERERDGPGGFNFGVFDFLGNVRGGIVVGHSPGGREEAEEERPARGAPTGVDDDVGPDVGGGMLVVAHGQERDAAGHENRNVEYDVGFGHLLECAGAQAVQ